MLSSPSLLTSPQIEILENVKRWMKNNAYEPSTIKYTAKRLKQLIRNTDFNDPENVKTYIANKNVSNAYKESLVESYAIYMRMIRTEWNKPFYDRYDKAPKIPKEQKMNLIIANARRRLALFLTRLTSKCKNGDTRNTIKFANKSTSTMSDVNMSCARNS